ncbi:YbaB/EbfC family nucleoid-associated protein [Saccharopolyspora sp. 5N102]|uniref:YbaB/EbfC family nucleoid-associated protein n=1 Tax=Saccharopolyspora sp. 5N102 TaxID=3375155 RepID=UPI00379B15F4
MEESILRAIQESDPRIDSIAKEIQASAVTVTAANDTIKVTAMPTGHVTNLVITPEAIQHLSAGELSNHILSAIQSAAAQSSQAQLKSLISLTGNTGNFNQLYESIGLPAPTVDHDSIPADNDGEDNPDEDFSQTSFLQ